METIHTEQQGRSNQLEKLEQLKRNMQMAEKEQRCFWSRSTTERDSIIRRAGGTLCQPMPRFFARREYWATLQYRERIMHVIRAASVMHLQWIFCGVSAAVVWELTSSEYLHKRIHVAKQSGNRTRNTECFVFHHIPDPQLHCLENIQITGLLQTMFDVARFVTFPEALAMCDAAMRKYGVTHERMDDFLLLRQRCQGIREAREVFEYADALSENGGESIARGYMKLWGYEKPELQAWFDDPVNGERRRVDYLWRTFNGGIIIGELDGREKYEDSAMTGGEGAVSVVLKEKERESNLNLVGKVAIVRFGFRELMQNPAQVQKKLDLAGVPKVGFISGI